MAEVVEAGWVLPVRPWSVLEDAAVAVADGRIVAVGSAAELRRSHPDAPRLRRPGHVLLPGLVNAHTHAAMSLLRGFADDVPLMTWLHERIWPAEARWVDEQFVADGTRLAAAEMLRGGVTSFGDMYFFPVAGIEAARAMGIRIVSGQVVVDGPTAYGSGPRAYLRKAAQVVGEYRGVEGVHIAVSPHAPYTVSDGTFRDVVAFAEEHDVGIHTHLHETAAEVREGVDRFGTRPLARLDALGVLGPRLVAAHAVHLDDAEIGLLAQRGAALVHCPTSNAKLASGIARLADWLAAGLTVGLGTDGAASNNTLDVLGEMRLAALLAKGATGDASAVPAAAAVTMATLGGAAALGLGSVVGSLEPGKAADMIMVDLSGPDTAPVYDPVSHLVYAAGRQHVSDVWVAGRRRVADGQLLNSEDVGRTAGVWARRIAADHR